ncbi:MAG: hypothetical protein U0694_24730 [Anaerolineae bacterium]
MTLPPDPESEQKWADMPKNQPSKDALPPLVFGGNRNWLWLIIFLSVLTIIGLILSRGSGY